MLGKLLVIYTCNFHVLSNLLLIYICKLHWNLQGFENDPDQPPGGWVVVACFHTLWSSSCVKLMPELAEVVPYFQDSSTMLSVRADGFELATISRSLQVHSFPTLVIFRGGIEVDRLEGNLLLIYMCNFHV